MGTVHGKVVVIRDGGDHTVEAVIFVKNYDADFTKTILRAEEIWENSNDEYFKVVFAELRNHGYEIEDCSYELYDTFSQ